ncbi:MAG: hypothetical protein P8126_07610 [Gammaproteobacteria bacterium]|jgi:hypothetical protein
MNYLDYDRLDDIDEAGFRSMRPYPWANPARLLTDAGYQRLLENLPDVSLFTPMFDVKRSHGQQPHDRFTLEYQPELDVPGPWHEFIAELNGPRYYAFIKRLFGRGSLTLNFHWHYTPTGCSVSPHCDATRKIGSHIFYFNTPEEWDPSWGGETLILDDNGRLKRTSAPGFDEFDRALAGHNLGNYSLLFRRQGNSWHGVKEIRAPEGHYRKVFIVVINDRLRAGLRRTLARLRGNELHGY